MDSTVGKPDHGYTKRMSSWGLLNLHDHQRDGRWRSARARAIVSSVPSIASTANKHCPKPRLSARYPSSRCAARCRRTRRQQLPAVGTDAESKSPLPAAAASTKPSLNTPMNAFFLKTFATAQISESVFFRGNAKRQLGSLQPGESKLKILLCFTAGITARFTPSLCISSIAFASSPGSPSGAVRNFTRSGKTLFKRDDRQFDALAACALQDQERKSAFPHSGPASGALPALLCIVSGMKAGQFISDAAAAFPQTPPAPSRRNCHAISNSASDCECFLRARQHAKRFWQSLDALRENPLRYTDRVRPKHTSPDSVHSETAAVWVIT